MACNILSEIETRKKSLFWWEVHYNETWLYEVQVQQLQSTEWLEHSFDKSKMTFIIRKSLSGDVFITISALLYASCQNST